MEEKLAVATEALAEEVIAKVGGETSPSASERLLSQFRQSLKGQSSFPAHAKAVSELRRLASDSRTAPNQVAELILKEPSLATRLLHIVNSSFYRRAKPIMTVTQAVIQIGMEPLIEIFSGIALLKSLIAEDRDIAFLDCLKKTICTSLLASSILPILNPQEDRKNELGYLIGMFSELGVLGLAHYFPRIYETTVRRALLRGQKIDQSIRELTGLNSNGLSLEVLGTLDLPPIYKTVISICAQSDLTSMGDKPIVRLARTIRFSQLLSNAIILEGTEEALTAALEEGKAQGLDAKKVHLILGALPEQFSAYCEALDITVPGLPEFLDEYSDEAPKTPRQTSDSPHDKLNAFLDEIKSQINDKSPAVTVITTVMETLTWGLNMDRVLLLLKNKETGQLVGRTILGQTNIDPKSIVRSLSLGADRFAPDAKAAREGRPIFQGDPLLPNGWPIVALPVGLDDNLIGIIYADRMCVDLNDTELTEREKGAAALLCDLMHQALKMKLLKD